MVSGTLLKCPPLWSRPAGSVQLLLYLCHSVSEQEFCTNTIVCILKATASFDDSQLFLLVCIHQYHPAAATTPGTLLWALQLCAHSCPERNVVYFQSPPPPTPRLPFLFLVGSQTECIRAGRFNCKQSLRCRCRLWVTFRCKQTVQTVFLLSAPLPLNGNFNWPSN